MVYRRTEKIVRRLAQRHAAIVAAARAAACDGGMEAVQIIPVAERAGIAVGTVYRYFPSKTDLVAALVDAVREGDVAAIRAAANAAPGPLSALAAAIITMAARLLANPRLAWAILAEPAEAHIDPVRLSYRKALIAELEMRVTTAIHSQRVPEQDAGIMGPALVGAIVESLIGPLAPDRSSDPVQTRNAIQAITLFALRALGIVDARARGLIAQAVLPGVG